MRHPVLLLLCGLCPLMLLTTVALSQPAAETQTLNLRPQWSVGQTSEYDFWTRRQRQQNVKITVQGQPPREQEAGETAISNGRMRWVVDEVRPDGGATCTMTIDHITIEITNTQMQGKQTVDTRKAGDGDNADATRMMKALTGVPMRVVIEPDGSVKSVEGVDEFRRKLAAAGGPPASEEAGPSANDLVETASDLASLPGAPTEIRLDGRWDKQYRWDHELGSVDQDVNYRLAGFENIAGIPVATVTGTGKLKLDVDRSKFPADGPPIDVKQTQGTLSTQVYYDLLRHEAVGRNTLTKQVIQVKVSHPQVKIQTQMTQTVQEQVLRVGEGE